MNTDEAFEFLGIPLGATSEEAVRSYARLVLWGAPEGLGPTELDQWDADQSHAWDVVCRSLAARRPAQTERRRSYPGTSPRTNSETVSYTDEELGFSEEVAGLATPGATSSAVPSNDGTLAGSSPGLGTAHLLSPDAEVSAEFQSNRRPFGDLNAPPRVTADPISAVWEAQDRPLDLTSAYSMLGIARGVGLEEVTRAYFRRAGDLDRVGPATSSWGPKEDAEIQLRRATVLILADLREGRPLTARGRSKEPSSYHVLPFSEIGVAIGSMAAVKPLTTIGAEERPEVPCVAANAARECSQVFDLDPNAPIEPQIRQFAVDNFPQAVESVPHLDEAEILGQIFNRLQNPIARMVDRVAPSLGAEKEIVEISCRLAIYLGWLPSLVFLFGGAWRFAVLLLAAWVLVVWEGFTSQIPSAERARLRREERRALTAKMVSLAKVEIARVALPLLQEFRADNERRLRESTGGRWNPKLPHPGALQEPTPRRAEEWCAQVMGWLGAVAPRATPTTRDGGIDIVTRDHVCQVKHQSSRVAPAPLQQLVGAALAEGKKPVFFALSGYSKAAISWAERQDMLLFQYTVAGELIPCSSAARRALREGL